MTMDWQRAAIAENFIITTARLLIRPLAEQDLQLYLDLYTDPATMKFISAAFAESKAADSFQIALRVNNKRPFRRLFLAITDKDSAAGLCAISRLDESHGEIELGLMLKRRWHAKGYAEEALNAFIQRVQQHFAKACIWADIDPMNKAAIRLATKVGFVADPQNQRVYWLHN